MAREKERKTHYPLQVSVPAPSSVGVARVLAVGMSDRRRAGGRSGVPYHSHHSRPPPLPATATPGPPPLRVRSFLLPASLSSKVQPLCFFLNVNSRSGQESALWEAIWPRPLRNLAHFKEALMRGHKETRKRRVRLFLIQNQESGSVLPASAPGVGGEWLHFQGHSVHSLLLATSCPELQWEVLGDEVVGVKLNFPMFTCKLWGRERTDRLNTHRPQRRNASPAPAPRELWTREAAPALGLWTEEGSSPCLGALHAHPPQAARRNRCRYTRGGTAWSCWSSHPGTLCGSRILK